MTTTPVTVAKRDALLVSEVFGPTVQGEGPNAGRRCGFLRLGECNLDCSWCDTKYTWDWEHYSRDHELESVTFDDLVRRVEGLGVKRLVITGGEPLVHRTKLTRFLVALNRDRLSRYTVEIETNGTLTPSADLMRQVDQWNVSPKLAHSGVSRERAWRPEVLRAIRDGASARGAGLALKFVCRHRTDLVEVDELVKLAGIPVDKVWIMPEGVSAFAIVKGTERIADAVVHHGYNLTTRLHVLAWGNTKGT